MGYESKIIVVDKSNNIRWDGKPFHKVIAMYDMCKFNGWVDLFNKDVEYDLYTGDFITNEDELITEDCYGEKLKTAELAVVIDYLEDYIAVYGNDYRRVMPLLGLLKGFDPDEWDNLEVVHYGY